MVAQHHAGRTPAFAAVKPPVAVAAGYGQHQNQRQQQKRHQALCGRGEVADTKLAPRKVVRGLHPGGPGAAAQHHEGRMPSIMAATAPVAATAASIRQQQKQG